MSLFRGEPVYPSVGHFQPSLPPPFPVNGDIWYDGVVNALRAVVNGSTVSLGPSGTSSIASVNLTGQTGSIGTTTLYAVPSNGAGMYVVYADVIVTTAGTGGTVAVNTGWNNGTTAAGLNSTAFALTAQGEQGALIGNFYSAASQNITYSTSVIGATGNPQYSLKLRLVYLG